ncbi:MAG TPA: hypothetical protein VN680_05035 [Burkholderiaceae bacterium]|nr:hypothetical protein [Burkholderiaceae bacterium]
MNTNNAQVRSSSIERALGAIGACFGRERDSARRFASLGGWLQQFSESSLDDVEGRRRAIARLHASTVRI